MVNDAFKLSIDLIYKPQQPPKDALDGYPSYREQPFKVTNYSDNMNMWQKICNISSSSSQETNDIYSQKSKYINAGNSKPTEYEINNQFV